MKKPLFSISALLIAAFLTIAGCSGGNPSSSPSAAETAQAENASAGSESETDSGETAEREKCDQIFDDAFAEIMESSKITAHYLLVHPENYGVDISEPSYPSYSEEDIQASFDSDNAYLDRIAEIDRSKLDESRLLTLRMLENALRSDLLGQDTFYLSQPLSPEYGDASQLPSTLADYRFDSEDDISAVISYVNQMGSYFDSLIEFEKKRIELGIPMDDETIDRSIESIQPFLVPAEDNILVTSLPEKLDALGLSEDSKNAWIQKMTDAVNNSLIPAYTKLESDLESLKGHKAETTGLAGYEGGTDYFRYLLASVCGEDQTPEEIENRVSARLLTDLTEMGNALQNDSSLAEAGQKAGKGFDTPEEIMDQLEEASRADFPDTGDTSYEIRYVQEALSDIMAPAFFYTPTLDGDDTNLIYINSGRDSSTPLYTMLAHEGYPGHLYQSAYFKKYCGIPLRRILANDGYSEGWGEYAQIYSYRLDPNLNDAESEYLEHEASATLGIYALLDLRLNYDGWDKQQTADFLRDTYGIEDSETVDEIFNAIVDSPCEYLKYYIGYLEITDFCDKAQKELGDKFDMTEFHRFILDMCGADFGLMREEFETWLTEQGAEAS